MRKIIATAAVGFALAASPAAFADQASSFLKKAITGNYAEVAMGELAKKNASSQDVKDFGDMLIKDHGNANSKALDIAKRINVTDPGGPTAKQKKDHDKLAKLRGSEFDKAFKKHMVVDHEKDIDAYTKASKASNTDVAQYAADTLPTLKKHLDKAQSLPK